MTFVRKSLSAAVAIAALAGFSPPGRTANLVVCTEASPDMVNAAGSGQNTSFDVTQQFANTLVDLEPGTSNLRPALATSWTVSPDGKVYTFALRANVAWQSNDGFKPTRPLDADDVAFTFARFLDADSPFSHSAGGRFPMFENFLRGKLASVAKVDDMTVAFTLSQPFASFLSILSLQPFSIASAEYGKALVAAGAVRDLDLKPIGTGPFRLTEYRADSLVRFAAFPQFWDKAGDRAAKVDNLIFAITPDPTVRLAKLRANECQIARYPNLADLDAIRAMPSLKLAQVEMPLLGYIALRTDRKPFDDLRVRQALALALDLKTIVAAVFHNEGAPAAALVPAVLWGHADGLAPRAQDIPRARALLAEAGYPNGFETELWPSPAGRSYLPDPARAAVMIQADWEKIGVRANIVNQEAAEFTRRLRANEASVALLGQTWDYPDPAENLSILTCNSPATTQHVVHWCSKDYDAAFDAADRITDQSKRTALYQAAQKIVYDALPVIQLADAPSFAALRAGVSGFHLHPYGGQSYAGVTVGR